MSEIFFRCPSCNKSLKTTNPKLLGKKIKCPKCGGAVPVPAGPTAPAKASSPVKEETRPVKPPAPALPENEEDWPEPTRSAPGPDIPPWEEEQEEPRPRPRKKAAAEEEDIDLGDLGKEEPMPRARGKVFEEDEEEADDFEEEASPKPRSRPREAAEAEEPSGKAPAKKGIDILTIIVGLVVVAYVAMVGLVAAGIL